MSGFNAKITVMHYRVPLDIWNLLERPKKGKLASRLAIRYMRQAPSFVPAPVGGVTVASIRGLNAVSKGIAMCSFSDNYCYKEGRRIAIERLAQNLEHYIAETGPYLSPDGVRMCGEALVTLREII